jgi:hypothetical protein
MILLTSFGAPQSTSGLRSVWATYIAAMSRCILQTKLSCAGCNRRCGGWDKMIWWAADKAENKWNEVKCRGVKAHATSSIWPGLLSFADEVQKMTDSNY